MFPVALAQPGCVPSAGCAAVTVCPSGSLYCANVTLADSMKDFSAVQGQRDWYYGRRDATTPFTQLEHFNATLDIWLDGTFPQPSVGPDWGHPLFTSFATASVRLFVAPTAMTVTLSGSFANTGLDPSCVGADGTTAYIRLNEGIIWSHNDTSRSGIRTPYILSVTLQPGDLLAFEIWPNQNSICDASAFTASLVGPCASANCVNIVCNYSTTPCSCDMPWSGFDCSLLATTTLLTSTTSTTLMPSSSSSSPPPPPPLPSPSVVNINGVIQVNGPWTASPTQLTVFSGNFTTIARVTVNGTATLAGIAVIHLSEPVMDTQRVKLIQATSILGSFTRVDVLGPSGDCTSYSPKTIAMSNLFAINVVGIDAPCPITTDRKFLIFGIVIAGVFAIAVLIAGTIIWFESFRPHRLPNWLNRVQRIGVGDYEWR